MDKVLKNKLGNIGEYYVALELSKLGVDCIVVGGNNRKSITDIICNHNITIEVKTSLYSQERKIGDAEHLPKSGWGFGGLCRNGTFNQSDLFAFVLLWEDLSLYKIIYVRTENIKGGSWWYLKPNENTTQGKRGPLSSETTWKRHFLTATDVANLIIK